MIIDIHTHTFPEKIAASALSKLRAKSHTISFTDGTISMLARSMADAGIGCSVIQPVATKPEQVIHVNDASAKINRTSHETGIISFGCIHPDFEGWHEELARISELGIKGIKIHPVYQGVPIDDERYTRILSRAGELGLAVLIHAGWDIGFPGNDYALPGRIARALRVSGDVKVILAHMGGWRSWREAEDIFADSNAMIDTAFSLGSFTPNGDGYYEGGEDCAMLEADEFVGIVRAFGADRVLFGTDSPWASQADSLRDIEALPLTEDEKRKILGENAMKLFEL